MNGRKYDIATGKSRFDKIWRNTTLTWGELLARLSSPVVTPETMADFKVLAPASQTGIKDVGGFVGGYLEGGVRKVTGIRSRSLVTLDYDRFDAAHLERVRGSLDCAWAMHSTHKHTPSAWRVRLVVACSRDMTPDEYGAVARRVAEACGFEGIDRSTFEPCRLMFWPSRPKDAPFLWETGEGEPLDVDATLAGYADWRDMSAWPMLPEEEAGLALGLAPADGKPRAADAFREQGRFGRQEDPRQKRGLVGAFCRAHDIEGAIAAFLPEVYTKSRGSRYTHAGSSTAGGAWVLDGGRFLYSFHSTDPCCGRLMNSWDLVRLHRFGDLDRGAREDTRTDRLPSTKAMERLALEDRDTKLRLMDERRLEAASDFAGLDFGSDGTPGAGGEEERAWREWDEVRAGFHTNKRGDVETTITTVHDTIMHHPALKGRLRLNRFTGDIDVFGSLPWERESKTWTNTDDAELRKWLDAEVRMTGKDKIQDALVSASNRLGYHPVKDYLESIEWDGAPRLGRLFIDVLGAADTPLNRRLAELFFTAAVRRIYRPGEKFDYFIILQGPEGCGKSSLFSLMGGEWFSDSVVTIEGKDGMESIQGAWIIEIGELIGVKRSEAASVKSFISRQEDVYRPAYGRVRERRRRQCVLVGTTNDEHFLRGINDKNRRSPVVEVRPELRRAAEGVREDVGRWRDQLWAEAVALHRRGEPLYLDDSYDEAIREVQDRHNLERANPVLPDIDDFLDMWLPDRWDYESLEDRRNWWKRNRGDTRLEGALGHHLRETVTVPEILQELLEMSRGDREYSARSREVGQYLNSLSDSWEMKGSGRSKLYGVQKTWHRKESAFPKNLGYTLNDL